MDKGFPKYAKSAKTGDHGVELVSRIVSDNFGWLFKRNHQEHDFGIDGQVEVITDEDSVTGQMFAIQIKCGKSFLQERNQWGYVYRGEIKHFNYLANYPIPIVICICDPEASQCYWVRFEANQTHATDSGWKITVPFENNLSKSKLALLSFLQPIVDKLDELHDYWALNKLIISSSTILYPIQKEDILLRDVSGPRGFFDRLRSTKELAYECQGKAEISFSGYDNDPRELYEIKEVRSYIQILSTVLPELFFFSRSRGKTGTLRTFSLCHTKILFLGQPSKQTKKRKVEFETASIRPFLERHLVGLNEMTDWLSMPVEDNMRITFDVVKSMGLDIPPEFL